MVFYLFYYIFSGIMKMNNACAAYVVDLKGIDCGVMNYLV